MYKLATLLIVALFGAAYAVPSQFDTQQAWTAGNLSIPVPLNALSAGADPYGFKLYVARVNFSGTIVPCRLLAESGVATCTTESIPFTTRTSYQLLNTKDDLDYEWVRSYDGHLEDYAVSVGTSQTNERVFICRTRLDGGDVIGSLFLSKKACLIHAQSEYIYTVHKYEVLVAVPKLNTTQYYN